ncbi:MAG: ribonuclease Y [Kiritimatiellales bacterium]|nr:ribonuclease Y [Kiritimatiellales bacterium]
MEEMFAGQGFMLGIGFVVLGFFFHAYITKTNAIAASKRGKVLLAEAEKEADVIRREAKVQAMDAALRAREKIEKENTGQRKDILDLEKRVVEREKDLSRKIDMLNSKEQKLEQHLSKVDVRETELKETQATLLNAISEENKKLESLAQFSQEEARETIMKRMGEEVRAEAGGLIRHIQRNAKEDAHRKAAEIITNAIQRYAADQVNDVTTSTVTLASDDMKGRIIGREGRNIKSFESETGVNVLIDETPEVVVLSSFDPIRREVARVALERLMEDGRIHPVRIEEVVTKVREEIDDSIRSAGEEALFALGVSGVAPELVHLLGRLKFRTSFKQNVLDHSVETAHLMSMMAAELGLDTSIAKRIGIFHDIGKAVDHEVEGRHAIIGGNLMRKHGEDRLIYNAVASHHEETERDSIYAVLCDAADAITAARPGARSETTDLYLKRLEKLEKIATNYTGVTNAYAVQAGRELRVMVEQKQLDDNDALILARNIARQIENEVKYPGQITVTVIRETRCVEYAK